MAYRNSATVPTIDGQFPTLMIPARVPALLLTWRAVAVLGCDKPEAAWEKPLYNSTISHRSSSVKPSMRSSRSRTTLVGYDEELEYKPDTAYGTTNKAKAFTWWDHLLGVFCIRRGGRVSFDMTSMPKPPEENEVCGLTAGGREVVTNRTYRMFATLRGFYLFTFSRVKRTSQDISYRRKPNVRSTPEIFKGTWCPKPLSPMFLVTLSPTFNHWLKRKRLGGLALLATSSSRRPQSP
jgi:hypothetical protein